MTDPPQRPGDRPPNSPGRREGPGPRTTTQPPAHGAAKPLSPALDTTFKIGLVLKGLDGALEVAGGILLLFLSPQAIQHLARVLTAHQLIRKDDGGEGDVAGGGAGSVAHQRGQRRGQRGDAGGQEVDPAAPPERGEDDDAAAGAGVQPSQQNRAGEGACGDGGEQPVSAAEGVQPAGGQDSQHGAGRPGDDNPPGWP
jgi:hypothetical protein